MKKARCVKTKKPPTKVAKESKPSSIQKEIDLLEKGVQIPATFRKGRDQLLEFVREFATHIDQQMEANPEKFALTKGDPYYMVPHRHDIKSIPRFKGQLRMTDGSIPIYSFKSLADTKQDSRACLVAIEEAREAGDEERVAFLENLNAENGEIKSQLRGAYLFARACGLFLNDKEEAIRKKIVESENPKSSRDNYKQHVIEMDEFLY